MSFFKLISKLVSFQTISTYGFLLLGGVILGVGLADVSYAAADLGAMHTSRFRCLIFRLTYLLEGNFGALILIGAGVGTIVAMMAGAYKAAATLFSVAALAFIMRSLVVVFFAGDPYFSTSPDIVKTCNPGHGINTEGVAAIQTYTPPPSNSTVNVPQPPSNPPTHLPALPTNGSGPVTPLPPAPFQVPFDPSLTNTNVIPGSATSPLPSTGSTSKPPTHLPALPTNGGVPPLASTANLPPGVGQIYTLDPHGTGPNSPGYDAYGGDPTSVQLPQLGELLTPNGTNSGTNKLPEVSTSRPGGSGYGGVTPNNGESTSTVPNFQVITPDGNGGTLLPNFEVIVPPGN